MAVYVFTNNSEPSQAHDFHVTGVWNANRLRSDASTANQNGVATMTVAISSGGARTYVTAMLCDFVASLPGGQAVTAATLRQWVKSANWPTRVVNLNRLLVSFNQTQSSWDNRATSTPWNTAGAQGDGTDRVATPFSTLSLNSPSAGYYDWECQAEIAALYGGATNVGWLMEPATMDGGANRSIDFSRETDTDGQRPELYVTIESAGPEDLVAESGSYAVTGTAADLLADRALPAESGAFALAGADAQIIRSYTLEAESGSYSVIGAAAGLLAARVLDAEPGSFAIGGTAADLLAGRLLDAESGTYVLTGADADLVTIGAFTLEAESGTYQLTGTLADLLSDRYMLAEMGVLQMTASDVEFLRGFTLDAEAGEFVLTGTDVAFDRNATLVAESGAYSLDGTDVDLIPARLLTAESGAYELIGNDAALLLVGSYSLQADPGEFLVTGAAADLLRSRLLEAESGEYVIAAEDVDFLIGRVLQGESGTFTVTGADVTLRYSGDGVAPTIRLTGVFNLRQQLTGSWN